MMVTFSLNEENACEVNLYYHSRCSELLPNSDLIVALQEDLTLRTNKGIARLKEIMEDSII